MRADNDNLSPDAVTWCGNLFRSLNDKGVWAVPRSGLLFQRQGDVLVLVDRMPHIAEMPVTADELVAAQDAEFDAIQRHFAAVSVTVTKALGGRV